MTPNDITLHAYNATYPDEPMNMPQMLLYMTMRVITLEYKYGIVSKDTASTLKTKALVDYAGNLVDHNNGIEAMQDKGSFYKRIELATSAYRLERKKVEELTDEIVLIPTEVQNVDKLIQLYKTIENADKVLEAIYG